MIVIKLEILTIWFVDKIILTEKNPNCNLFHRKYEKNLNQAFLERRQESEFLIQACYTLIEIKSTHSLALKLLTGLTWDSYKVLPGRLNKRSLIQNRRKHSIWERVEAKKNKDKVFTANDNHPKSSLKLACESRSSKGFVGFIVRKP